MGLTTEAARLYFYSKKLTKLNNKLRKLGKKAERHANHFKKSSNDKNKNKYKNKHYEVKEKINEVMKTHSSLLRKIKHHAVIFNNAFRKEHQL